MEVLDEGLAELLHHIATLAAKSDGPANEVEGRLFSNTLTKSLISFEYCSRVRVSRVFAKQWSRI